LFSDPEAPPTQYFFGGYSIGNPFRNFLLNFLKFLLPTKTDAEREKLAVKIIETGQKYKLGMKSYGVTSTVTQPGHYIQVMVHKSFVDTLAYASKPYGITDPTRVPLSKSMLTTGLTTGQARIYAKPQWMTDPKYVRIFHYSAESDFQMKRKDFQKELLSILKPFLDEKATDAVTAKEGAWIVSPESQGGRKSQALHCEIWHKCPNYSHPHRSGVIHPADCVKGAYCTDYSFGHQYYYMHMEPHHWCPNAGSCRDFSPAHRATMNHRVSVGYKGPCRDKGDCTETSDDHLFSYYHPK
jgi:hypothetical protein